VSTQVTPTCEKLLQQIEGGRRIKASMNPFNRKGRGKLPRTAEEIDAPAFGVRVSDCLLTIIDTPEMRALAKDLLITIPSYQLNTVIQSKIVDAVKKFKAEVQAALPRIIADNSEGIARLERFANDIAKLTPDSPSVMNREQWYSFVSYHSWEGWHTQLHTSVVLRNFGFQDASVRELNVALDRTSDAGMKERINKALSWISKAFGCYGLIGSLSDPVNLAFAMTNTPVAAKHLMTEDLVIAALQRLKVELQKPAGHMSLWIPSIHVHDCEMDDTIALLILFYVHKKKNTVLEVYAQLPKGEGEDSETMDNVMERLAASSKNIYRDPEGTNIKPIAEYWLPPSLEDDEFPVAPYPPVHPTPPPASRTPIPASRTPPHLSTVAGAPMGYTGAAAARAAPAVAGFPVVRHHGRVSCNEFSVYSNA